MNISNIIFEQHMANSNRILLESCHGLDTKQREIVESIHREFQPLIEASLSADQIKNIFGAVEKSATDAGDNRTALGAAKDIPGKVNDLISKFGTYLQNTTPVKMADQKFEQLKAKVGAKFPNLDKQLTGMGTWMKENPGKSAAIIGLLTALASLAGGPVGGAIAGQVLRGAAELIKGEKLSTAIGKGVKTAVFGFLSGKAFEMLGDFAASIRIKSLPFGPETAGFEEVSFGASKFRGGPGWEWTETIQGVDIIVDPEMASAVRSATNMLRMGGDAANEGFEQLDAVAKIIGSSEYKKNIIDTLEISRQELLKNDSLLQFINTAKQGLQAVSQGAVAASTGSKTKTDKKENLQIDNRPLSEGQVYLVFKRITESQLNEGPMDAIKGLAGKVMNKARTVGTNLTTKVTADKLNSAWQKAGAPTDSNELAKFLEKQGVSADVVNQVYGSMKLPAPGSAEAPVVDIEAVKKMIATLPTDRKIRLLKSLEKGENTKTDAPGQPEPTMS
jgi:hypothetical protein